MQKERLPTGEPAAYQERGGIGMRTAVSILTALLVIPFGALLAEGGEIHDTAKQGHFEKIRSLVKSGAPLGSQIQTA